jgi:two-component system response regulator YesN
MKPDKIIAIIGYSKADNSKKEKVFQGFSDLCLNYENQGIDIRVGIGSTVGSIWECSISYQSSKYALQYQFSLEEQKVFDISAINIRPFSSAVFSDNNEEKLINLIYKRDRSELKKFLIEQHEKFRSFSFRKSDIYTYLYSFILKFSRLASSIGIPSQAVEKELADLLQNIETIQPDEIFEWLYHLCELACVQLDQSLKTYHEQLCEKVNQYIQDHYQDNELSLTSIAEHVNLSVTYLSTIYKRETGINIIDVIAKVRLAQAKVLLKTTTLPINAISEMTGFSNQYYFSAFFKKNVGVTPSIFRNTDY